MYGYDVFCAIIFFARMLYITELNYNFFTRPSCGTERETFENKLLLTLSSLCRLQNALKINIVVFLVFPNVTGNG